MLKTTIITFLHAPKKTRSNTGVSETKDGRKRRKKKGK